MIIGHKLKVIKKLKYRCKTNIISKKFCNEFIISFMIEIKLTRIK